MSSARIDALIYVLSEILEQDEGMARNAARIFFKLFEMGRAALGDISTATRIHHTTCSSCLKSLWRLGIVVSERIPGARRGGKKLLEYHVADNWDDVLGDAVGKASEDLQRNLTDAVASLQRMKEIPPVFAFQTMASGHKLTEHELLAAKRKTIGLYQQATKSVMIMSREFGWIEEALPTLLYVLRSRPTVSVRLLISWKETSESAQKQLLGLRKDFSNYDHRDYDAGILRMSIIDRTRAIVIKKALREESLRSEGIEYTEDEELVSHLLADYFELKFKEAGAISER